MKTLTKNILSALAGIALQTLAFHAFSQEDVIRKNLADRIPNLPHIEEVTKSPIAGLYEIRVGGVDIYYTDAGGNYLIDGQMIEAKSGKNITQERIDKLSAIDFKDLPLKDAILIKRGTGARKVALFEDPNCPYCKHFEEDMKKVNNVSFYLFLYPILGEDSTEKSKRIWCSVDRGTAWQDWMLLKTPPRAAQCNTDVLTRNVDFGKKHRINGTPTIFLADGSRIPGAITNVQLEKLLAEIKVN